MDRLQSLEVFIAVAEAGSFVAGARKVGLSAPSATRGINALEARLGARLLSRTTRRVRLTDVGKAYLEDARHILAQMQAADDAATGAAIKPSGQLRITCPTEFGRIYVAPILTDFLDLHHSVTADVLMVDRIVNMVEEGFDLAVRIGELPSSGLTAVRVGQVRRLICGTPEYFEKNGRPETPADLQQHQMISASPVSPVTEWRFGSELQTPVRIEPRLIVSSVATAISVARRGWGLCRVLSYQVGPDLQSGKLQTVLEDFEPTPLPIHLVHVEGRRAPAKVRAFVDLAKTRLRAVEVLNSR
ncbi:regulatory protein, LysR:LysR, substrate-binding [Roseobacter sp. SK209-2-6]|uniref:LysR family transcriptional regulator n=1 Tax=Roseobacter sp. SK209-2-6 TaxID=388739 RepID=UPI0000F3CEAE|nr:LysR family transcriptional regulator [Roseobacter sp. SK209-2-6]EBA15934.1 regulatory protein, LysR:LysR, substrate-binding [Roseobacter sp. SK209-2-6]